MRSLWRHILSSDVPQCVCLVRARSLAASLVGCKIGKAFNESKAWNRESLMAKAKGRSTSKGGKRGIRASGETPKSASANWLNLLFEQTLDGIVLVDLQDQSLTHANPAFCQILGYTLAQVRRLSIRDLHPPGALPRAMETFKDHVTGARQLVKDMQVKRKDGRILYVDIDVTVVEFEGRPHLLGVFRDASDRRESEESLRQSESALNQIYENLRDAFVRVSLDGQILEFNQAYREMLGYSDEELLVLTNVDLMPARWHEFEARIVKEQVLARGYSEVYEKEYCRKDGTILPVELRTFLARDESGPLESMWAIVRDISARKQAELALKASEDRYREAIELISDYIFRFRVEADGRAVIESVSPNFERITGRCLADVAKPDTWLKTVHPEDRPRMVQMLQNLIRHGGEAHSEFRTFVLRNGMETRRWVEVSSKAERDPATGRVSAIIGVVRNVSDRKAAEIQQNLAVDALREGEARFRKIVEQSPMSMAIVGLDGTIEFINGKAIETFGYSPADIPTMDRWWVQAYPDVAYRREVLATWTGHVERAIAENREIQGGEYRVTCKDGTVKTVFIFGVPVANKVFVMFDDITERKHAEMALHHRTEELVALVESLPGVFYLFDEQGRFLRWNRNFEAVSGYSAEEIAGLHPLDFFGSEDKERIAQRIGLVFSKGSAEVEAEFVSKKGGRAPYFFTGLRVVLDGKPCLIGVGLDITVRKQAEEALRQREAHYRALIETTDTGYVILDSTGRVIDANPHYARLAGRLDVSEVIGRSVLEWTSPGDVEKNADSARRCLEQGSIRNLEIRYVDAEGRTTPIEINATVVGSGDSLRVLSLCRDITARKRAEEELERNVTLLRSLSENLADGMVYQIDSGVDGATRCFTYLSTAVERMHGLKHSDALQDPSLIYNQIVEEDRVLLAEREAEAFARREAMDVDVRVRRASGDVCWRHFRSTPRVLGDGRVVWDGIEFDVTTWKQAEEDLRLNASRLDGLLELSRLSGTSEKDLTDFALEKAIELTQSRIGYLAFMNEDESVLTMYSWSRTAMRECAIQDKPVTYPVLTTGLWGEAVRQRRPVITNDYQAPNPLKKGHPSGHVHVSRHMNIPLFDGDKIVLVAGVGNKAQPYNESDVRQLTLLMDGMWKIIRQRRMQKERNLIFDLSLDLLCIAGFDGYFKQLNPAWSRTLGWSHPELCAKPWLEFVHPDDHTATVAAGEELRAGRLVSGFENRYRCKNGSWRWLSWHSYPLTEEQFAIAVVRDVTELKLLQERLRQSEKLTAIGQLAGGIAHDFNNQLAGVMGYADLLTLHLEEGPLKRYAQGIAVSARRAADLTQQLLAYGRKGKYLSVAVDIHRLLDEVVAILERSIDKRIRISQVLRARHPVVLGDPTQIQNALLNLALNARDAMPQGGALTFETDALDMDEAQCRDSAFGILPGPYLRICVADTGGGMTDEVKKHLFEPFFTTKKVGEGTGMGLASAYGTVRNHRGAILVQSEVGRGTTVCIDLPLAPGKPKLEESGATPSLARGTANILLVDDERTVREMACDVLRDLGYTVVACADGREAVEYYREHWRKLDLVILDMVMPQMGGREAFVALRGINPDVRALLSSGYSLDGEAQSILDEGVLGFIGKPYHRTELSRKIEEALGAET